MLRKIINKLPGFNCGNCGYSRCDEFAEALLSKNKNVSDCPILIREEFKEKRNYIEKILNKSTDLNNKKGKIIGLIDNYEADIVLEPLRGENSCREVLLSMGSSQMQINDIIRYRPLGCPITHFAKIIEIQNFLLTVHIIGPGERLGKEFQYKDIGTCIVLSFEGKYHGKNIKVGETVRFLPKHCMMQKIHSGVVVNIEKDNVIIEGIDLKVWEPAHKFD